MKARAGRWALPTIALAFSSCTPPSTAEHHQRAARYLALGDSYTVGESVDAQDSLPAQLARRLGTAAADVVAATGWTTTDLAERARARRAGDPYDLVTLLIGANDVFRNRHVTQFGDDMASVLALAIWHAGGRPSHVVVISIPDYTAMPAAANSDESDADTISNFSEIASVAARDRGARFVWITELSRQAADDPALVASDGLHPSAEMIRRWVDAVEPVARQALEGTVNHGNAGVTPISSSR